MTKVAVALFLYRRPEQTARVFAAIREYAPDRLFLIADGPKPGEEEICQRAREAVSEVDWPCEVTTGFSPINLGSGRCESMGISFVLGKVYRAIFLEDDCLPDPTFWTFCEEMLEAYAHDEQVMCISGDNFHPVARSDDSYWFSRYPHLWGWATWRRAWQHYDFSPLSVRYHGTDPAMAAHWTNIRNAITTGAIDCYDYQWMFAMWQRDGLCITPAVNMVHNIGFGEGATNMTHEGVHPNPPSVPMAFPLRHPAKVEALVAADRWEEANIYLPRASRNGLLEHLKI